MSGLQVFRRFTGFFTNSNKNIEFCINPDWVKNLPFDRYEKDFTFIVNEKRYQTSRIIADFLSPIIRKYHYSDPSINQFQIDITDIPKGSNDYFSEFLSLMTFEKSFINKNLLSLFMEYFYKLGNIDGYFDLQPDYIQSITVENILSRLQFFTKKFIEKDDIVNSSITIKVFEYMIEYASENFESLDKDEIAKLQKDVIESIIRNDNLKLCDEDSLIDFIFRLCEIDPSYANLFEYVLFSNVSKGKLEKFVEEFNVEYINNRIFQSICKRFFENKENENEKRYLNKCKEFKPKADEDFDGILRYLTNKTGGNIHDNGTIEISSNSVVYPPKNAVDYQNSNIYHSKDDQNSFVKFDFKDKSIQISSYSIQSTPGNYVHLKNWAIDASKDGKNWEEIDRRSNDSKLNGFNNKSRFDLSSPPNKFYRYFRLRETGEEWNNYYIGFAFIEIYGKLQEPKT